MMHMNLMHTRPRLSKKQSARPLSILFIATISRFASENHILNYKSLANTPYFPSDASKMSA